MFSEHSISIVIQLYACSVVIVLAEAGVDEKKKEHDDYLAMLQLIIMATRRSYL